MRSGGFTFKISGFVIAAAVLAVLSFYAPASASPDPPIPTLGNTAAIEEDRAERLGSESPRYSRANYYWPYASGPFYGSAYGARVDQISEGLFRTAVGTFDLRGGSPDLPDELRTSNRLSEIAAQYFVIAVASDAHASGALGTLREAIDRNGGAVVRFASAATMIARLTPDAMVELQKVNGLLAVEPYHGAFKLHPSIGRTPLIDPAKALSEVYDLDVRVFEGEDTDAVAVAIEKLGGWVVTVFPDTVRVEIHRSRLAQLARLEPVEMVYEHLPVVPFDEETTTTIQTGSYNQGAVPFHDAGIDGGGGGVATNPQVLMIVDTGIQLDAADLAHSRFDAGSPGPQHRKVRLYQTTEAFGGDGDLLGCDAPPSNGFTHGHMVAAVALGRATDVDTSEYGDPYFAMDDWGNAWSLDGVAPGAVLVSYDAQRTPAATSCADPLIGTLEPGDLYSAGDEGVLADAYVNHAARVFNLSWGQTQGSYESKTQDIDEFLHDMGEAVVLIAAGNSAQDLDGDYVSDPGSLGSPAGAKNALAVGASLATLDLVGDGGEEARWERSSTGPAPGGRVAPQIMAPGWDERYGAGLYSAVGCRSSDNDQSDPVECDVVSNLHGTSYSAAGAAGAALLVRDYFAQGFYPDGTSSNPTNVVDQVDQVSGALIKAVLIASADFMDGNARVFYRLQEYELPSNLSMSYRFNNEQGYGRVQLDNALPLQSWPFSPPAMSIVDGGIDNGIQDVQGMDGVIDVTAGQVDIGTFEVCDPDAELRVALAWFDRPGEFLVNDLDLELRSPSGTLYLGNYFTDDDNRDGFLDATTEDCPSLDGTSRARDESQWSLPACQHLDGTLSARDRVNPTEAIMLSPDPLGSGTAGQIEVGTWTVTVTGIAGVDAAQRYALVVVGGLCQGSRVSLDRPSYSCNDRATITVFEHPEAGDPSPTPEQIAERMTIQVLDGDTVVDEEKLTGSLLSPAGNGKLVSAPVVLTDGTEPDPGNGALDVRHGNVLQLLYADVGPDGVTPDPERTRVGKATVDCALGIAFGNIVFEQFGVDTASRVSGGCERNARGEFDYGFPDRYLDAGELVSLAIGFSSIEYEDIEALEARLRCVIPDADSPKTCGATSLDCPDPVRANNPSCDQHPSGLPGDVRYLTVLDSPRRIGLLAAKAPTSVSFTIQMEDAIAGTPDVEFVLTIDAPASGRTTPGVIVLPFKLDVDEESHFYSTDFPTGGTEFRDWNNNEALDDPTSAPGGVTWHPNPRPHDDYRFESFEYSDLTAGGTKNLGLMSPWNFDANDGGFRSGLLSIADESSITNTIAQWGEDKNFNGIDDKRCTNDVGQACTRDSDCESPGQCVSAEQRDPADNVLDKNWSIRGGCGWQTKAPGTCSNNSSQGCFDDGDCVSPATCTGPSSTGGIWHTGRIGGTTGNCLVTGSNPGQCQAYEVVGGSTGARVWAEALVTPRIQKVNGDDYKVELQRWAWNQAVDLSDERAAIAWEFDGDVTSLTPTNLYGDGQFLGTQTGPYGAISSLDGWTGGEIFAPLDSNRLSTLNGTLGNNREGNNACFFEGGVVPADMDYRPPVGDDDIDNDGDGLIDEFVTANGPVRNYGLVRRLGPSLRYWPLEDRGGGEPKEWFQAAITMINREGTATSTPAIGYGLGIDDMVVDWREYALAQDETECTGECAVVDLKQTNGFEGSGALDITVIERSPLAANDCDLNCLPPPDVRCNDARVYCAGGISEGAPCTDVAGDSDCPGNPAASPPVPQGDCVEYTEVCLPACAEGGPTEPRDCDDDGVSDVVLKVTSGVDRVGETVYVNAFGVEGVYKTTLPISTDHGAPGVLFVGATGIGQVDVTAEYLDYDDGTGQICANEYRPELYGTVRATADLYLLTGNVTVTGSLLTDNGDQDGFADTNETVAMQISVRNGSDSDLTGVTAGISTNDPRIDCILGTVIYVGDIPAKSEVFTSESFVFRVGEVDRTGLGLSHLDELSATFDVLISADQFDSTRVPQTVTLDLDLDATGGGSSTIFFEGFESGTFGAFEGHNMDRGLGGNTASDGYRCQYHDPDWFASNSYGSPWEDYCYLTTTPAQGDAFFWQVHTPDAIDGGKAYSGTNSLYMGVFGSAPDMHTTPLGVLESVKLREPINLGNEGESPRLSFKHQIDLMDGRKTNSGNFPQWTTGTSLGRGVVQVQLADGLANPVGPWIKIHPYLNVYDQQAFDFYVNCTFDPIDDGNTEDDFFDPTDPDRRLGPSSTCFPEFSYTFIGETFDPYSAANVGNAEGPGLKGTLGLGTWIESRFNLERFRGRSMRIRFLNTDLGFVDADTWEQIWLLNPSPGDDGWWIDDVTVTNTLTEPVTMGNDDKDNSALPACGVTCNTVQAALSADPPGNLPAPRHVVELSAVDSVADRCVDGILQFRFWRDLDSDGAGGGPSDELMLGWTADPGLVDAPAESTSYVVEVRCSSDPTCFDSVGLTVGVDCPSTGTLGGFPTVVATDRSTLVWGLSLGFDYSKGWLDELSTFATTGMEQGLGPAGSFDVNGDLPVAGRGLWYLFRQPGPLGGDTGYCNAPGNTWGDARRDAALP